MAGSSGTACPCFPCAFFGRRFLSRMRKCVTSHGRPQAASMPHRTEMGIPAHFPSGVHILPRNRRRKRSTENRDRHSRCCRPLKKLTHGLGKKECWYFLLFPKRHGETGQGVCRIITFLPTLPVTFCKGLFNQFHKKFTI